MTSRPPLAATTPAWPSLPSHQRWLAAECDRLLDFAEAAAHPDGGFAWLDADGRPLLDRPVETWITCRMTHVFALAHLLGRPGAGPLVDHGVAALTGPLHDGEHGGWFAGTGEDQQDKRAYDHAFVVLAASSATAAGQPGAEAAAVAGARGHGRRGSGRPTSAMVADVWDRTWTQLEDYRGVNANMHSVEAFLAASDVTGDDRWRDQAAADHRTRRARLRPRQRLAASGALRRALAAAPGLQPGRAGPPVPALRGHHRPPLRVGPARAARARSARRRGAGLAARRRRGAVPAGRATTAGPSTAPTASSTRRTGTAPPSSATGCTGWSPRPSPPPQPCSRPPGTPEYEHWYRTLVGPRRHLLHRPRPRLVAPPARPAEPALGDGLGGQARRLPRAPGHAHPACSRWPPPWPRRCGAARSAGPERRVPQAAS